MIMVVLALLAFGGGAVYWFGPAKTIKEKSEEITPPVEVTQGPEQGINSTTPVSTQLTDELAGWQEYKNERFPYKIKYPPDWYFLKTGYNPPPPVGVMFSNLPEGYQPGVNAATIDIFVLPAEEKTIEEIGEVKNLVEEQYYQKTPITISGEPALRLETPDKSESNFSIYFLHKGNSYRIVCGESGPGQPEYGETFQKILDSFTFTD